MDTHLNLLAATICFLLGAGLNFIIPILFILVTMKSQYSWIALLYWMWIWLDRKTPERGGRRIEAVTTWSLWQRARKYFESRVVLEDGVELNPERNYIFSCFPHAIIPIGAVLCFVDKSSNSRELFPHHKYYICTVNILFSIPILRDIFLAIGLVSCSTKSISYLLKTKTGGTIVGLFVGGAAESSISKPNTYRCVVKNRKGFVKLALQNGSPLVPVISFNETNKYDRVISATVNLNSEWLRKIYKYAPPLYKGRYLVCPNHVPITLLVGPPIEVEKNDYPTTEEIDKMHQLFMDRLSDLFERNKHKYALNPDDVTFEII